MSTGFGLALSEIMAVEPSSPAVEYGGRWYSWSELAEAVSQINAALDAARIGPQHRTGVLIRNRPPQLAAMLALFTSARSLVVLNPMLPHEEVIADLAGQSLAAVIGETSDLEAPGVREALGQAGCAVIALDPVLGRARLEAASSAAVLAAGDPAHVEVAVDMLTSGTTGPPKRVPLSRKAFDAALDAATIYEKGREPGAPPRLRPGVTLHVAPLAHIGGMFAMLNTLLAGRRLVLFDRFTVQAWHAAVVQYRPKVASLVPAALRMVLDANVPREDLASLTALRSGTAPLPPEIVREFLARYDLPVLQNYGATEFIGGISGWTLPDFRRYFAEKPRSCGRIHDGVEARIIDPESETILPAGQEGVLELKTAQIHGGRDWYRTTDRAIIDADNFLTICGRTDAAIIRGGFKVHPDEVVRVLEQHPAVREASVVGLPDERLGAIPAAAVIVREGMSLPTDEITAFVKARLSPYQVPVRIIFFDDLPRTPSMKPSLPAVRERLAEAVRTGASSVEINRRWI